MIHLNYRDTRPIYEQIVDSVCTQIAACILQPGDKLPSVRELASQLSINPNTIQRAYRELEAKGVIQTVPGKGCFVCAAEDTQQQEKLRLLHQLDETVTGLTALGMTAEQIIAHIRKEES